MTKKAKRTSHFHIYFGVYVKKNSIQNLLLLLHYNILFGGEKCTRRKKHLRHIYINCLEHSANHNIIILATVELCVIEREAISSEKVTFFGFRRNFRIKEKRKITQNVC